jgi:hypothetical protein
VPLCLTSSALILAFVASIVRADSKYRYGSTVVAWTQEIGPGSKRILGRPGGAGASTMNRTHHQPEQIIRKLKTAEHLIAQGKTVADVGRVIEVTQPTLHR